MDAQESVVGEKHMNLSEAREIIDRINRGMLHLFIERMEVSQGIAQYKQTEGLPVRDEGREQAILDMMMAETPDDLKLYTGALFETLFALSRAYQEQLAGKDKPIV